MMRSKNKDDDINKAILEWIVSRKYSGVVDSFLQASSLKIEDATKGDALEKRWSTILTMQKKISDLQTQVNQLKEDLEKAGTAGVSTNGVMKKENESMVRIEMT